MPWTAYSGMTDEDLRAIYAYLRTLPPVSHVVANGPNPTQCRKCGLATAAGTRTRRLAVALPNRRDQVLGERAGLVVARGEAPVAAGRGVVDVGRPGVDDLLPLEVGRVA